MGTMSRAFCWTVSSSNSGCVPLYPSPSAQGFFCPSCSFSLPVFLPLQRKHCYHLLCAMMSPLQIFFSFRRGLKSAAMLSSSRRLSGQRQELEAEGTFCSFRLFQEGFMEPCIIDAVKSLLILSSGSSQSWRVLVNNLAHI